MATHPCPKCNANAFTWSIQDETERLTNWTCASCGYTADEDETKKTTCGHCGQEHGSIFLRDSQGFHRWCFRCGRFAATDETFG